MQFRWPQRVFKLKECKVVRDENERGHKGDQWSSSQNAFCLFLITGDFYILPCFALSLSISLSNILSWKEEEEGAII